MYIQGNGYKHVITSIHMLKVGERRADHKSLIKFDQNSKCKLNYYCINGVFFKVQAN